MRSQSKIALATASSAIAATVLEKATTSHSRYKIPLKVSKTMTSNLTRDDKDNVNLFTKTVLAIWDEITMAHQYIFDCASRAFNDLTKRANNVAFNKITMVVSGDDRQTAPIIRNGSKFQIINAAVKNSKHFKKVTLVFLSFFFNLQLLRTLHEYYSNKL